MGGDLGGLLLDHACKIAFDVLPVFKYLLSVAAAIIALWLIDRGIDVLAYLGYEVSLPDKSWLRMLLRR